MRLRCRQGSCLPRFYGAALFPRPPSIPDLRCSSRIPSTFAHSNGFDPQPSSTVGGGRGSEEIEKGPTDDGVGFGEVELVGWVVEVVVV
ncbi:hypothetical protein Hdeb2414_s0955g00968131 [Helianthus debilis subsp. tardiflorus]